MLDFLKARLSLHGDPAIARIFMLLITLALLLLGLVMVYSSSVVKGIWEEADSLSFLFDQVKYALLGIVAGIVAWKVPVGVWRTRLVFIPWLIAVLLIILVATSLGVEAGGAKRWLAIAGFSMQPSEFAKIAFVMVAAHLLAGWHNGMYTLKEILVIAIVALVLPIGFMYRSQSDLGTTMICAVGIFSVLWYGGVSEKILFVIAAIAVVFLIFSIAFTSYRADRLVYLDPWNDGDNGHAGGWQTINAYYALADGGLFGVGLGNSHAKYLWLSEAETDFIFAILCEELGLIGGVAVIIMFVLLFVMGMRIANAAMDPFSSVLAASLTTMIVFQAFLNISFVVGLAPVTGKPLPFISSGGSSLIATMIMVGLVMAVADEASGPSVHEERRAKFRVTRNPRMPRAMRGSKGRGF